MTAVQHLSHAQLLAPPVRGRLPLGGIVAPATRGPAALMTVVKLGAALGVPVVLLCSGEARPDEVLERASSVRGARCLPVDVSGLAVGDRLPSLRTSDFPQAINHAYGDLSLKRNLGLIIGRLAGWPSLLFLDDDIRGLSASEVRQATGALDQYAAVGMPARDFPDNSVVCHARRVFRGEEQDVFVSGSALAVNVLAADSFFPEIYNEDWLFLAPHVDRRQVSASGKVRQDFYNPFDDPARASKQEFGDVLAEGIYSHLHGGTLDVPPTARYWKAFLDDRGALIRRAIGHCRRQASGNPVARDALRSLKQSAAAQSAIHPRILVDYVGAWRADLDRWRKHVVELPCPGTVDGALDHLGLTAETSARSVSASSRT
jgi:hypothetical protein